VVSPLRMGAVQLPLTNLPSSVSPRGDERPPVGLGKRRHLDHEVVPGCVSIVSRVVEPQVVHLEQQAHVFLDDVLVRRDVDQRLGEGRQLLRDLVELGGPLLRLQALGPMLLKSTHSLSGVPRISWGCCLVSWEMRWAGLSAAMRPESTSASPRVGGRECPPATRVPRPTDEAGPGTGCSGSDQLWYATTAIMPTSPWYALWQCSIHWPGLSASKMTDSFFFGSTMEVSLRGPLSPSW